MAEAAPPTGMGTRQLREWIQEWGSVWDFLGLAPGSAMSEVLRAYKRTAIRLHPDKSPPDEVEMATVRMQALGNAKEILLNPSLRVLHDNLLGVGVTGGTAPPPSSAAPDGGSGGTAPHHGWWNQAPPPKAPPTSSSSSAPPPSSKSAGKAPPPYGRGPGPSTSARGTSKGKSRGRWGTPFYDTSSEEFSSAGPDTESSGPEIDQHPRIRCGRVRLGETASAMETWGGDLVKDLLVMENLRVDLSLVDMVRPEPTRGSGQRRPRLLHLRARAALVQVPHIHLEEIKVSGPAAGVVAFDLGRELLLAMCHSTAYLQGPTKGTPEQSVIGPSAQEGCSSPKAVPGTRAPLKGKIPTKAPPPSTFNNAMRWICGGCGEPNGLHRYGCNGCGRSQHAAGNVQERATHWICPDCQEEDADVGGRGMESSSTMAPHRMICWCTRGRLQPQWCSIDGGPGLAVAQEAHSGKASAKAWEAYHTGACTGGPPPGLDRDEQMEGEQQAPPPPAAAATPPPPMPFRPLQLVGYNLGPTEENRPMAIVAPNGEALWFTVRDLDETTPRLVLPWTVFQHVLMCRRALCGLQSWGRVGVIFIRRVAQDILYWVRRKGYLTRIQLANSGNPCFVDLQEAHPEPQGDLPPLSPATGNHRPLFTFQDYLRNPSLGQHYRNNEGPPRPGRTALPCIYTAPSRQLPLAESYAEADRAQNVMGRWAMQILGDEPAVPPDDGAPPAHEGKGGSTPSAASSSRGTGNTFKRVTHWYCKRCSYGVPITRTICTMCQRSKEECVVSDEEEEDDEVDLNEEELEEVARLERECAELEQRMRGLNAGQQRALLENLAKSSSAVMGGLLADTIRRTAQLRGQKGKGGTSNVKVRATAETARNDPKYVEDLDAGVSMAVAFQRHRSRLRAVQHQVAQGNVALQPRATPLQTVRTLPPMMSLGRSHRLYLLNRLERLERRGVTWTQEEVRNCYTMEQFLDYLEARADAEAERAEPTTASKSAGAPPSTGAPPPSDPTSSTSPGTSSAPSGTTADGRPGPPPPRPDPAEEHEAGRPVDPDQGHDQPGAHPSTPSATSERGEAAGDTAPAESDLPADDSARRSAVDGFHL
ncbi:ATJ20 [Symbiodinium sp. CCMP2592]|nr:ATJ20 [Symbiodinium sp. CCMP2592]